MTIRKNISDVFDYVLPIDLSHIFKRCRYIAGVEKTSITSDWRRAGLTREVYFKDGSRAEEYLETVNEPYSFKYRISKFTSLLRFLVKEINGELVFTEVNTHSTKIDWTYSLVPQNHTAAFIVRQIVIKDSSCPSWQRTYNNKK
jgi:hypothetical protein